MNKFLYKILFIAIVGSSIDALAVPRPPDPPGKGAKAPIGAGAVLLLVAGSVLGISKIRKNKKDTF